MVKLQSDTADAAVAQLCDAWRKENSLHEQAWVQLQAINGSIHALPKEIARATLKENSANRSHQGRRTALKSIALVFGAGSISLAGYRYSPWQQWVADQSTAVGEQRNIMLADGTKLILNTDSAVDIQFTDEHRLVKLLKGEILISTGHKDSANYRPFSVQTGEGTIQALGTQFLVRQHASATQVAVFEGAVKVQPDDATQTTRVDAGQQLYFSTLKTEAIIPADPDISAWADGVLVAKNTRLADFVAELDRYHNGKILCDNSASDLTISGVFPLKDSMRVIVTLQETLPITAQFRTRYWVTLHKNN